MSEELRKASEQALEALDEAVKNLGSRSWKKVADNLRDALKPQQPVINDEPVFDFASKPRINYNESCSVVRSACVSPQAQTPPATQARLTEAQNHKAFEEFVKSEMGDIAVMDAGRYISPKIQNYWRVWEAASSKSLEWNDG